MRNDGTSRIRQQLAAALLAGLLAACGGGGDSATTAVTPPPPPAATADVTVTVADTLGRFVAAAAVTVASSGTTASTDATGKATLKVPVGSEQVLTIDKSGFAEQVRLLTLDAAATKASLTTLLVAREPALTIASIEAGGSATGKDGVTVRFPAGALVDSGGRPVSGTIDMLMTPLDISTSDVGAFPGAFEGTAAGTPRSAIVTFGTSELVPQQGGQKLQLAAGKTATIELPIYATTLLDGTPVHAGDTIPFWSLATGTGLWTQEGSGSVVVDAGSPTGLALRATISHFSWWNVDQFAQRATVNVTVNAVGTTVPAGTLANVVARVTSGTGPMSSASIDVSVGTAKSVQVAAPATLTFSTDFDVGNLTCSGSATAGVTPGATADAVIQATCIQVPTPTMVVPQAVSATNSSAPTRVQIVLSGPQPDSVELRANGTVVATFGPQFFYVELLDTAALPEGTTTLQARATLAGHTQVSNAVDLVIDRTPPQATQSTPDSAALVGRDTTFTVQFDEPVNALPFTLADAVTLAVMPIGQSTPTPIAADVALDVAGLTLTVTPRADLPPGTASLGWGGLRDAAGNHITGTIAATWDVDRSSFAGPLISHFSFKDDYMGAAIAIDVDGSLIAAHKPDPGDFVALSRYDAAANTWNVFVPAVNERTTKNMLQLAFDSHGTLYIAFAQVTAADPNAAELVLKRFNGSGVELAAPVVPLPGNRTRDITRGSVAIDASDRPVITLVDPNDDVRLFRLEQGALVSLGTVATLAAEPEVALQPDGTPLVAFLQGFGGSNAAALRVAKVVNGSVQLLGGTIDSVPDATQGIGEPRIVMRGSEPWLFWNKFNGGGRLTHAARFDGTSWIDTPFPVPVDGSEIDAAILGGDPVVAAGYGNNQIQVLRFRNGAWEPGFDATSRVGGADRLRIAVRGSSAALISSNVNDGNRADVQRLAFP